MSSRIFTISKKVPLYEYSANNFIESAQDGTEGMKGPKNTYVGGSGILGFQIQDIGPNSILKPY